MTLTAKTYGDGRGMITSAWLPTKWFVIASAILNSNTTVITLIVTPCVHWGVQNNIIKTGTLSIMADVCAKWVVVITLVVPLLPNYFITSCVPGVEARAACSHHTHTLQAHYSGQVPSSVLIQLGFGFCCWDPRLLQCVLQMASAPVWRKAMQHYTLIIVCFAHTCL